MGAMYEDLDGHEGYGIRITAATGEPADVTSFTAYRAACACGWRGGIHHPPTHDGYDTAVDEWDARHAQPLLQHALPADVQQLVDDTKSALINLRTQRPLAAQHALDNLATWATAAAATHQPPTHPTRHQHRRPRRR